MSGGRKLELEMDGREEVVGSRTCREVGAWGGRGNMKAGEGCGGGSWGSESGNRKLGKVRHMQFALDRFHDLRGRAKSLSSRRLCCGSVAHRANLSSNPCQV